MVSLDQGYKLGRRETLRCPTANDLPIAQPSSTQFENAGYGKQRQLDADVAEHQALIKVCRCVPRGVPCLWRSLKLHKVGTQLPQDGWVALPDDIQTPALSSPKPC